MMCFHKGTSDVSASAVRPSTSSNPPKTARPTPTVLLLSPLNVKTERMQTFMMTGLHFMNSKASLWGSKNLSVGYVVSLCANTVTVRQELCEKFLISPSWPKYSSHARLVCKWIACPYICRRCVILNIKH